MSDSLQPHGLQHARLPCPSLPPGVKSYSICVMGISEGVEKENNKRNIWNNNDWEFPQFNVRHIMTGEGGLQKTKQNECPINYTSTYHFLEKELATHYSILAWRIPGMGEPGGLLSMGSHRVRHDWSNLACMHALEKKMATHSSILPGESQGQRSPVGCRLQGRTELDMTDVT